jgi:hypothetical protein
MQQPYSLLMHYESVDTLTPGYAEEMKTKTSIAKKLCESGSVFGSKEVAADIIAGSTAGYFTISTGLDGWLMKLLHIGLSPVSNPLEVALQVVVCPLRLISAGYVLYFNYLCREYVLSKQKESIMHDKNR